MAGDQPLQSAKSLSPSVFLSPSINADLHQPLEAIEELLLGGGGTTASPSTALAHTLNTTTTTTSSETTTNQQHSSEFIELPSNYSRTNAIHMEVQENSKLPSSLHMEIQENAKLPTFNLPVNRSNASWKKPAMRGGRKRTRSSGARSRGPSISSGDSTTIADSNFQLSPIPKLTTHVGPMESSTSRAIDEIIRLNENDIDDHEISFSEFWLDGEDRSSAALAYSCVGGMPQLLPHASSLEEVSGKPTKNTDGTAGRIPPSIMQSPRLLPYRRQKPLPIPTLKKPSPPRAPISALALATAAAIATNNDQMKSSGVQIAAMPSVQTMVTGPTQQQQQQQQQQAAPTNASQMNKQHPPKIHISPAPKTTVQPPNLPPRASTAPNSLVSKPGPPTATRPLGPPTIPPPKKNPQSVVQAQVKQTQLASEAEHSKTKASVTNATVQQSKVGVCGNQKVTSIPAPPCRYTPSKTPTPYGKTPPSKTPLAMPTNGTTPCRYTPSATTGNAISGKVTSQLSYLNKPTTGGVVLPPRHFIPPPTSTRAENAIAYERKKQRAKDARVRLNEAIEELGVAMDLAGSQSKERFNYIVKTTHCVNPHASNPPAKNGSMPPPASVPLHPLARLMDETIQQSASAKKWDRPSFVGLSATIIRSLNAQCEGLMREVAQLRCIARSKMGPETSSSAPMAQAGTPAKVNGVHGQSNGSQTNQTTLPLDHPSKKQKLNSSPSPSTNSSNNEYAEQQAEAKLVKIMAMNEQQRLLAIYNTVEAPNLLKNIASFLDPKTLGKCLCVSKKWRSQNIFQSPELWLNICIKRFGISAVRKWQDHEDEGTASAKKRTNTPNLDLYLRMSKENVKPYSTMEGTQFLGGSSLDGLIGCWVSLMDRSNGETSRSVMQQKILNNKVTQYYGPIPVVELRLLIQNTGYSKGVIIIPDQQFAVDASTRRKGEKMLEVSGDERFRRRVLHIERSASPGEPDPHQQKSLSLEMCHLRLFETAVLTIHIHARGCSTTAKFCNRSKGIQLLVSIDGTTRPLLVPFNCMNEMALKQQISH